MSAFNDALDAVANMSKQPFQLGQPVWLDPNWDWDAPTDIAYVVQGVHRDCLGRWFAHVVPETNLVQELIQIAAEFLTTEPQKSQDPAAQHAGNIYFNRDGIKFKCIRHPLDA